MSFLTFKKGPPCPLKGRGGGGLSLTGNARLKLFILKWMLFLSEDLERWYWRRVARDKAQTGTAVARNDQLSPLGLFDPPGIPCVQNSISCPVCIGKIPSQCLLLPEGYIVEIKCCRRYHNYHCNHHYHHRYFFLSYAQNVVLTLK